MTHRMLHKSAVVVVRPGAAFFGVTDPAAHNIAAVADRSRALAQHRRLRAALAAGGFEVVLLDELPGHPNAVFPRDPVACTPAGYVRLRMGLSTRRGEEDWLAAALAARGVPEIGRVAPPGTAEGGDVILAGRVAFIGRSSRTNAAGAAQVAAILEARGYEARIVDVPPPYLHLGGAMTSLGSGRLPVVEGALPVVEGALPVVEGALPVVEGALPVMEGALPVMEGALPAMEGMLLAVKGVLPAGGAEGFAVIGVAPADFVRGNVIPLPDGSVIAERTNGGAIRTLRAAGVHVRRLDLSEFLKGSGGPSCLTQPVPAD